MEHRHIAIFTPFAVGHVYPALALSSELVSRGHRVTYPTNERFAAKVRKAGATPIEFKPPEVKNVEKIIERASIDDAGYWHGFSCLFSPLWITTAAAAVAELESVYAADPPDLILYDWFAFAGRILARRLGRPAAQLQSHFAHHNSLMRLDGICTTPKPMLAFGTLLDSFMSMYGFEGKDHLWHSEPLNIFFVPKEFQYDPELFDRRFKFVGVAHNRTTPMDSGKSRTGEAKPLLLISEKTASSDDSFLRVCIEAFADSPYHVVFSAGLNTPESPSTPLPHNFEINRTLFNREILPSASIMLCQAGMGTTLEALHHGVPVVAVPSNPFNSEVAYRVAELGLGIHVPQQDMTPRALREAVDIAFSDKDLHRRVKQMQSVLERSPGAKGAADAVEAYLAR